MNNIKRSSETLREALNFDNNFLSWFIGFAEGNGCFCTTGKRGYLEFKITQSSSDAQVLFYIKKQLGFGSVSIQDKKNNTHYYRVRDKENLIKIINIFNGNLLTEKKNIQFKHWLECFNVRYQTEIEFIPNINKTFLDIYNNGWLAGFTDSEVCFTAYSAKKTETYTQIFVNYILSQKGEKELMHQLSNLLDGTIHYLESYEGYNIRVTLSKLNPLINYFKRFPLKTKKNISFLTWIKIYNLVIEKKHLTPEGLETIQSLIKKLNKEF